LEKREKSKASDSLVHNEWYTEGSESMKNKQGLVRRKSGIYEVRVRVPKPLVSKLNRQEIKRSLGTSDLREARGLFPGKFKEINDILAAAQSDVAKVVVHLRPVPSGALKQIARLWFSLKWEAAERELSQPLPPHVTRELAVHCLESDLFPIKGQDEIRVLQYEAEAESLLVRAGYSDSDAPSIGVLANYLKRGDIDILEVMIRHHWNGDLSHTLRDTLYRSFSGPHDERVARTEVKSHRNAVTLDEAISSFENDAQRATLSAKNSRGYAPGFNLLREIVGGATALASVDRIHARRIRDVLAFLPPNASKRFPEMSLVAAAEHAKVRELPPIQATTATNILSCLAAFFNWARIEHGLTSSPFADLKALQKARGKDEQRQPFSAAQLELLFSGEMYSLPYESMGRMQPGKYWVPLLALYHGARMNELCQLELADIKIQDGLWCMQFTEESASDGKKTLKTASAHRTVPVHPIVQSLGFIDYCESARGNGGRLFPELRMAKSGYLSDNFSKWFSRYRKHRGVTGTLINFHSFRHGFNDACREVDVPEPIVEQLCGWSADGSMVKHYGKGHTLQRKATELAKVRFPCVEKLLPALQGVNDEGTVMMSSEDELGD
jgi:integrase